MPAGWWKADAACGLFRSVFLPQRRMFFSEWNEGRLLGVSLPFSFVTMDGPFYPVAPSSSSSASFSRPALSHRRAGGEESSERPPLLAQPSLFSQQDDGRRARVKESTRREKEQEEDSRARSGAGGVVGREEGTSEGLSVPHDSLRKRSPRLRECTSPSLCLSLRSYHRPVFSSLFALFSYV